MTWQDKVVESDPRTFMWEILVPTEKRQKTPHPNPEHYPQGGEDWAEAVDTWKRRNSITTRYHRVWDANVRSITGGLTIMSPVKGQWAAPDGELFKERMIPVRIVATRDQIDAVINMTMSYYDQLAILCYKISDEVILKHRAP